MELRARIAALEAENTRNKEGWENCADKWRSTLAELDSVKAELAAARKDAERLARYIVQHGQDLPDHACKQCAPYSDILIDGFECAYHRALAIDAALGKGEAG